MIDWTARRMNRTDVERGLTALQNATANILDSYVSDPALDAMLDWADRFQANATNSAMAMIESANISELDRENRDRLSALASEYHVLAKDLRREYRRLAQYRRVYR